MATVESSAAGPATAERLPELHAGDRLTRAEFERRYAAMPQVKKAELYDLHDKLRAYQRNGVCEYVVWRVWDRAIDWFVLREGRYERLPLNSSGHYQSEVFPGLWLDPAALVRGDLAHVMTVLQQGLASPEHAGFAGRLRVASGHATP
jgi:hypothetical protein